jgi:DNA-binding transcriptional ArsR family regulator
MGGGMTQVKDFAEASRLLKVLGHPIRLKIVCGLLGEPANGSEISRQLGVPISTLAQHLRALRIAGVLTEDKQGVEVIFHVADRRVPGILKVLCNPAVANSKLPRWRWQELHG